MRRFLASAWYPLLIALTLAGAATGAHAGLPTLDSGVSNTQLLDAFRIAGWAAGAVMGIVSFLLMGVLNLLRRMFRLRKIAVLHPIIVLVGVTPWLAWGWQLLFVEPRFTPFARLAIDVIGRPMFVGSAVASLLAIVLALVLLLPVKHS
ncbi:MAG: hypothetical protein G01um101425_725 [Candidatus Peregrinibacteria bacterium Gr01-1014_25]|nr:MAG: hypothetical protein G01um101425_725 [Candidatus Peregrinibacteria bacterium Gr01-1014_25]